MTYPPSSAAVARPGKRTPHRFPTAADMQALAELLHARLVARGDVRNARWIERHYGVAPAAAPAQEPNQ